MYTFKEKYIKYLIRIFWGFFVKRWGISKMLPGTGPQTGRAWRQHIFSYTVFLYLWHVFRIKQLQNCLSIKEKKNVKIMGFMKNWKTLLLLFPHKSNFHPCGKQHKVYLVHLTEAGRWFCYCKMRRLTWEKQIWFAPFKSEISLPQSHCAFVAPCRL